MILEKLININKLKIKHIIGYAVNLLCFVSSFLLISCSPPPPMPDCFDLTNDVTDNSTVKQTSNTLIDSKDNEWIDLKTSVTQGDSFEVNISGHVNIVSYSEKISVGAQESELKTQFGEEELFVSSGQKIYISMIDENDFVVDSRDINRECGDEEAYSNCKGRFGKGLEIYIGSNLIKGADQIFPKIIDISQDILISDLYKPLDETSKIEGLSIYNSVNKRLFILTNNKEGGKLGFKIKDNTGLSLDEKLKNPDFYNRGGYNLSVTSPSYYYPARYNNSDLIPINDSFKSKYSHYQASNYGSIEYKISSTDPSSGDVGIILTQKQQKLTANQSGKLWARFIDENYYDNDGKYNLEVVKYVIRSGFVGQWMNKIVQPVKEKTAFAAKQIYSRFINDQKFKNTVNAMLMLYIIIYAIYFTLGLAQVTQKELVTRAFKIGVVITLISENSWAFFNDHFLKLFTVGAEELLGKVTGGDIDSASGVFNFIDRVFNEIFAPQTWGKMLGLIPFFTGIIIILLIVYCIFQYVFVVIEVFIGYLMVIVGLSLLISLAPIFIILILFEHTKQYFDGWVKYLVNFSLQPIILFSLLAIFNDMILDTFRNMMSFKVCWSCVLEIEIDLSFLIKDLPIPLPNDLVLPLFCIKFYSVESVMTILVNALVFLILVTGLRGITDFAPEMTDFLTQVIPGGGTDFTGQGSVAGQMTDSMMESTKGLVGQDRDTQQRLKGNQEKDKQKTKLRENTQK